MKIIFGMLGLSIIVFLSGCATSNSIKNDSTEIWKETKKVSKETWYSTQKVSKEVWDDTKEVVHNATAE